MVMVPVEGKDFSCTSKRLFLWNEKLTRNQISESEGLRVIIIRRKYRRREPCGCLGCYASWCGYDDTCCSTVIPFDLSRLLNKDPSLFSMLLCATLQFPTKDIKQMANHISSYFSTKFPFSQPPPPPPRPPYVIALEISQNITVDHTSHDFSVWLPWKPPPPPPIPSFCRFEKDWDLEEEIRTCARSVSNTDYRSDRYHEYPGDVLEYIYALREYTGEGGMCPTKPPIAVDVPKGLEEVKSSSSPHHQLNGNSTDLMDDTCPVCYADF